MGLTRPDLRKDKVLWICGSRNRRPFFMNMFVLVTGGSGSGKSAYAEDRLVSMGDRVRYYLAAMEGSGEEAQRRIQRHRRMRSGKGFVTIERPRGLSELTLRENPGGASCGVLLECLSNLAANEMFAPGGSAETAETAVLNGIDRLLKECDNLVVVTNEVFSDGIIYDRTTEAYRDLLGRLNTRLAAMADEVVEVVCGIPVTLKRREDSPSCAL